MPNVRPHLWNQNWQLNKIWGNSYTLSSVKVTALSKSAAFWWEAASHLSEGLRSPLVEGRCCIDRPARSSEWLRMGLRFRWKSPQTEITAQLTEQERVNDNCLGAGPRRSSRFFKMVLASLKDILMFMQPSHTFFIYSEINRKKFLKARAIPRETSFSQKPGRHTLTGIQQGHKLSTWLERPGNFYHVFQQKACISVTLIHHLTSYLHF